MSFWKKLCYLLISVVLVCSCLCAVSYRGTSLETLTEPSLSELDLSETVGYEVEDLGDAIRFTPTADGAVFKLRGNEAWEGFVVLELAEPISDNYSTMSGTKPDGQYVGTSVSTGLLSEDGTRVYYPLDSGMLKGAFFIHVGETVTVKSISIANFAGEPTLGFNPMALAVVAIALLALAVVERRFGYFAWIKSYVQDAILRCAELCREGRRALLILQLFTWGATIVYVLGVFLLLLFGVYTKVSIMAVFLGTILAVALQIALRVCRGEHPSRLFLSVGFLLGLLLSYTMAPTLFLCWDDQTHFIHAFNAMHLFSGEVPLSNRLAFEHLAFPFPEFCEDPTAFVHRLVSGEDLAVQFQAFPCHPYQALAYLPVMAAVGLVRLLGADMIKMVVIARLLILLTYLLVIYFGIRRLRSGAYIAATVALIPTALFLATSINYDYWLTAWMIFGFAYLLSILQSPERRLGGKDVAKLLVAFFLAFGPKAIYTLMLLPLLILRTDRFESPAIAKKSRLWTVAVIGFVIATLVVPALIVPDLYTDTRGGSDVSTGGQISFILSHPFDYARILLRFLAEYTSFGSLSGGSIFYAYLGQGHVFGGSIVTIVLLSSIFTDRREDDRYGEMQGLRWTVLLTSFCQLVLIATSLYVGFTPVGHTTINGCQYRYIFALLFPFCYFMAPKGIRAAVNQRAQSAFVFGGMAVALLLSYYQAYLSVF